MGFGTWIGSQLWSSASQLARAGVRAGVLHASDLGVRVVSVGNIQVGGSGKTPLVGLIAREGAARGLNVCILSRGYRGTWEAAGGVIAPGSESPRAADCGDEPALLHALAPRAWIGVGADRRVQFEKVQKSSSAPIDLVILDDGFQHWKIRRDVEVIAATGARPSKMLFRDRVSALENADLVVWTKGGRRPVPAGIPCVKVRFKLPAPAAEQAPVILVTGLGDGAAAFQLARDSGYRVERHISFPDHASYSRGEIDPILEGAREGSQIVAITGKDWVKWRDLGVSAADVLVLEPELHFEEGRDLWEKVLWPK